jgi:hypothetical protein
MCCIPTKMIARLEATITKIDTSRPLCQWTDDKLLAYMIHPNSGPAAQPLGKPWIGGSHCTRHSASGASSWIVASMGLEWV